MSFRNEEIQIARRFLNRTVSKMADEGDNSSTSDESLDATSEKFDPLKALYSKKLKLLTINAPVYDNVSKFESVTKGFFNSKATKDDASQGECSKRRFQSHQEPVSGKGRGGRRILNEKNVLAKMQNTLGPLGMLHRCMESKLRVKVLTRNACGIRGHVEAYVAAFDKHWNLALEDCHEVWSRKVKRKAPALGAPGEVGPDESSAPKIIMKKSDGKTETLERHVPQMLLRGEQVAIIVKLN
ncbi:U7 snRNA-associated Sm-like protein LSm11 isoform X2 [Prorops nasuta]|uniref:U7 snRNA-associated Sm-like protein LSm11 isoform X2 n=1 Tax=Prorops nasuta TaxID=863751 RepID=UPI0034CD0BF5